jgi:tRNA C32,U32 (ribose-2'-O)-methylase TrmJ
VNAAELDQLYAHLEACMTDIGFMRPEQPRRLMIRLRRLFNRAALDENEYNILRGILTAAQQAARKK